MRLLSPFIGGLALLLPVIAPPLAAQQGASTQDNVEISADDLSDNGGRIAINIASGDNNHNFDPNWSRRTFKQFRHGEPQPHGRHTQPVRQYGDAGFRK